MKKSVIMLALLGLILTFSEIASPQEPQIAQAHPLTECIPYPTLARQILSSADAVLSPCQHEFTIKMAYPFHLHLFSSKNKQHLIHGERHEKGFYLAKFKLDGEVKTIIIVSIPPFPVPASATVLKINPLLEKPSKLEMEAYQKNKKCFILMLRHKTPSYLFSKNNLARFYMYLYCDCQTICLLPYNQQLEIITQDTVATLEPPSPPQINIQKQPLTIKLDQLAKENIVWIYSFDQDKVFIKEIKEELSAEFEIKQDSMDFYFNITRPGFEKVALLLPNSQGDAKVSRTRMLKSLKEEQIDQINSKLGYYFIIKDNLLLKEPDLSEVTSKKDLFEKKRAVIQVILDADNLLSQFQKTKETHLLENALRLYDLALEIESREPTAENRQLTANSKLLTDEDILRIYKKKGIALFYQKEYQKAVDNFAAYIKEKTDDAEVYYLAGLALVQLGKAREATEYLQKAKELDPRYDYIRFKEFPQIEIEIFED